MPDIALPQSYIAADMADLHARVAARKSRLASSLCILGHHYQRDEVIQYADLVGDSLKLSQQAALQRKARYIVFCGVHFMAESADILTGPEQVVCLPNLLAGCAMADMADDAAVETALGEMAELAGDAKVVPITYVNSTATAKAITARAGGACCTSSNVANVFRWAMTPTAQNGAGADKIFAIPDQHLGRNTALALGYSPDECVVYDPKLPNGGLDRRAVQKARFILWKGQCYVHQVFQPADIARVRQQHSDIKVIVHPECPHEVVQLADAAGSTEQIIKAVGEADPGSKWAIGTEANLVNRLAAKHNDRFICLLADRPAHCVQMARITLGHLLWVLDNLAEGRVINQVSVTPSIAADARIALERMIGITAVTNPTERR